MKSIEQYIKDNNIDGWEAKLWRQRAEEFIKLLPPDLRDQYQAVVIGSEEE